MKLCIRKKFYKLLFLGSTLILTSCGEERLVADNNIVIESENEINDPFYETKIQEEKRQNDIEKITEEQVNYYNKNKLKLEKDLKQSSILVEDYDDMNTYRDLISVKMSDQYDIELYDYVYIKGVGNVASNGEGLEVNDCAYDYSTGVIIDIDTDKKYPYAVAKLEDNRLTSFIGWYDKKSLYTREETYGLVIERPLAKEIIKVTEDNFVYYSKDGKILCIPDNRFFPEEYTVLDDEHKYAINIDYTTDIPSIYTSTYFSNPINNSVYIVPEDLYYLYGDKKGIVKKKLKYKCNHELVKQKYFE